MLTQSLGVKEPFTVWEGRLKGPVGGGSGALWCRNDLDLGAQRLMLRSTAGSWHCLYLGSSPLRTPFFISGKSLLGKDGAQTQFISSLIAF